MNDTLAAIATLSLVSTALFAEANMLRAFIAEQQTRREKPRREHTRDRLSRRAETPRNAADFARRRKRRGLGTPLLASAIACAFVPVFASADPPSPQAPAIDHPITAVTPADPAAPGAMPPASSETAPLVISADRPGFSETTSIVPALHLQIESGYTFTLRNRDGVETQRNNAPEILARFGVLEDRLEVRLSTAGYVWSRTDDGTGAGFVASEGWSDIALGIKLKVADQGGWLPRIALDATTTLGAGSDNVSSQMVEPTLKFIWSYDLGLSFGDNWKGVTLGGNASVAWTSTNGQRFTQGQGSIYLNFPVFDRASAFVEYFVIGPSTKGGDAAHYVDIGGAYLLTDLIQLDARVGFGLNKEADNFFVGFGVSFLF